MMDGEVAVAGAKVVAVVEIVVVEEAEVADRTTTAEKGDGMQMRATDDRRRTDQVHSYIA